MKEIHVPCQCGRAKLIFDRGLKSRKCPVCGRRVYLKDAPTPTEIPAQA